jgi:P-type Cu2+ transporter
MSHQHGHTSHRHQMTHPADAGHGMLHGGPEMAQDFLRRFFIVTGLLVLLFAFSMPGQHILRYHDFALRPWVEFLIATVIFGFGWVFFQHARHEIIMRQFGMMTLVSLAVGAGYLFSAASTFFPSLGTEFYLEISTLIWVLLFGHYLEAKSSSAAGDALQEVAKLLPKEAYLLRNGTITDVPLDKLAEGDRVLIRPGEKVPADGRIANGSANFDEALISGESTPVTKGEGAHVVAGAICLDGSVEVVLDKVGANSTIGQIHQLISQAQQTKPSAQRLADRAANVLTVTALVVAILTVLIWAVLIGKPFVFALTLAITVLVIACPHALGLAIPTVVTIATKLAVDNGIFVKDLAKLEVVKRIDYVLFDKTGTLTEGRFGVTDVVPLDGTTPDEVLRLAAALEQRSSHPIARAVVTAAAAKALQLPEVETFKNVAGRGVQGNVQGQQLTLGNAQLGTTPVPADVQQRLETLSRDGKTVVLLMAPGHPLGLLALADRPKESAKQAVAELHRLGVKVGMLTGDNRRVAEAVATALGIDTYFAEVLPEHKYRHIQELQRQGHRVIMVGDGVNDAPALTQADVGVAIGAGTDVAVEAGDIVLTRSNPEDVVRLIVLARKTYSKMQQNLLWALGYNTFAIPAAAGLFVPLGILLSPQVGALLMGLSSVIVVLNALTLRRTSLTVAT